MAYTQDFVDAANRHMDAANCLHDHEPPCRRRDIAGYLYGIAAECAVEEIMRRSRHWREPERAHFPELKSLLRDNLQGRHAGVLRTLVENSGFMNEWDIAMRYAPRKAITDLQVRRWQGDATRAVDAMRQT